jgi:hypothetical protein
MKKRVLSLAMLWVLGATMLTPVFAIDAANNFEIIPQADSWGKVEQAVETVWSQWGHVRDTYNDQAQKMNGQVGNQLASGIMTRNTLLDYVVYLVRFLSQIGLVIGGVMIIYAGYLYATTIFWWGDASKGKKAITNAIIGILVIAFSYAIMKLLTSALIS